MVTTTYHFLWKVLGRPRVDEEELQTILVGIEATLNSRPTIPEDDNEILTPAHFLTGGKLTTIHHGPDPVRREYLTRSFRQHQRPTESLWRRCQREYLLQLRTYHEFRRPVRQGPKFKVGDIVLLQEERMQRHMWKKARIDELFSGREVESRKLASSSRTELKSVVPCSWSSPWRLTRVRRMWRIEISFLYIIDG